MKKDIHPQFHTESVVSCVCGTTYKFGSTVESISIEICAACHPFFTGQEKVLDTKGRVDKFKKRVAAANK